MYHNMQPLGYIPIYSFDAARQGEVNPALGNNVKYDPTETATSSNSHEELFENRDYLSSQEELSPHNTVTIGNFHEECTVTIGNLHEECTENLDYAPGQDELLPLETVTVGNLQEEFAENLDYFPVQDLDPLNDPLFVEQTPVRVKTEPGLNSEVLVRTEASVSETQNFKLHRENEQEDDGYRSTSDDGAANNVHRNKSDAAATESKMEAPVQEKDHCSETQSVNITEKISAVNIENEKRNETIVRRGARVSKELANIRMSTSLFWPERISNTERTVKSNLPRDPGVNQNLLPRRVAVNVKVVLARSEEAERLVAEMKSTREFSGSKSVMHSAAQVSQGNAENKVNGISIVEVPTNKIAKKKQKIQQMEVSTLDIENTKTFTTAGSPLNHTKEGASHSDNCTMCGKMFKNMDSLRGHIRRCVNAKSNTDAPDSRKCSSCDETFKNHVLLLRHIPHCIHAHRKKDAPDSTTCSACGETFKNHVSLLRHIPRCIHAQRKKDAPDTTCSTCGETFMNHVSLLSHIPHCIQEHRKKDAPDSTKCSACGETFKNHVSLLRHIPHCIHAHHKKDAPDSTTCTICGKKFKNRASLLGHIPRCIHSSCKKGELINPKPHTDDVCGKTLSSKRRLLEHTASDIQKPFDCYHCAKGFPSNVALQEHLQLHVTCAVCKITFGSKMALKVHESKMGHKSQKNIATVTKPVIDKNFTSKSDLSVNLPTIKNSFITRFQCQVCQKTFGSSYRLGVHYKLHSVEKTFCCDVCGKAFQNANTLKLHKQNHGSDSHFSCGTCKISFNSNQDLKKHVCSGIKKFPCDVCGSILSTSNSFKKHMYRHRRKPIHCRFCGKTFSLPGLMRDHIHAVHTFEKPFRCNLCNKSYTARRALRKHVFKHMKIGKYLSSAETYECICGANFTCSDSLRDHMSSHIEKENQTIALKSLSSIKPYECNQCVAAFHQPQYLQKHICKYHTANELETSNEKSFRCDVCNIFFTAKQYLTRHNNLYHRNIMHGGYSCDVCGASYCKKDSLMTHKNKHHTGKMKELVGVKSHIRGKLYQCNKCSATFNLYSTLLRHNCQKERAKSTLESSGRNNYECNVCGKIYSLKRNYLKHQLKCHSVLEGKSEIKSDSNEANMCNICGMIFSSHTNLLRHKHKHQKVTGTNKGTSETSSYFKMSRKHYKCNQCNATFHNFSNFNKHRRWNHMESKTESSALKSDSSGIPYKCDQCDAVFHIRSILLRHKCSYHVQNKRPASVGKPHSETIRCSECNITFATNGSLSRHNYSFHRVKDNVSSGTKSSHEKTYTCNLCNEKYLNFRSLIRHKWNSHRLKVKIMSTRKYESNSKPYKCDYCSATYKTHGTCRNHMRRCHPGEKVNMSELKISSSDGVKTDDTYKCNVCFKSFPILARLRRHNFTHMSHDKWPFHCQICGAAFHERNKFNCHMRKH